MLEVLGHCGDGGEALHCEGGAETAGAEGGEFCGGDDFLGFLGGAEERYEDLGGLVGEEGGKGRDAYAVGAGIEGSWWSVSD